MADLRKPSLGDYIDQEMKVLGEKIALLTDEEVMSRLQITSRELMNARQGRSMRGVRLRAMKLSNKTIRYRWGDVLAFEWACLEE